MKIGVYLFYVFVEILVKVVVVCLVEFFVVVVDKF